MFFLHTVSNVVMCVVVSLLAKQATVNELCVLGCVGPSRMMKKTTKRFDDNIDDWKLKQKPTVQVQKKIYFSLLPRKTSNDV